jgi:hypothetical protein
MRTALSIACLSVQARAAGVMTTPMMRFSLVVSVVLLGSLAFLPVIALMVWLLVVAIPLIRRPASAERPLVPTRLKRACRAEAGPQGRRRSARPASPWAR